MPRTSGKYLIADAIRWLAPFDIFKADETGHLLWCGEAHTLDDAKLKVQAL